MTGINGLLYSRSMRGRSGPVSESKFALKTLKVSNDTINVRKEALVEVRGKGKNKEREKWDRKELKRNETYD